MLTKPFSRAFRLLFLAHFPFVAGWEVIPNPRDIHVWRRLSEIPRPICGRVLAGSLGAARSGRIFGCPWGRGGGGSVISEAHRTAD